MKIDVVIRLCIVIFVISTFFILSGPLNAQEKVFKLRYSDLFPLTDPKSVVQQQLCKEIEKRTDGRVKITLFPSNLLTPAALSYDAAVKGIADISHGAFSYTMGRQPMMEVIDYPHGYTSALQATRLANAVYKKFKPKELDDVKILYLVCNPPDIIHTIKKISKVEDIKGLRIRSIGVSAKVVRAFGGIPLNLPTPEMYDALQKGLCDGTLLPPEGVLSWKIYDMIRCTVMDYGIAKTACLFVAMNKNTWNSFPPDIQEIIEKVSEEWSEKHARVWDKNNEAGLEFVKGIKGYTIVYASKEEEAKTREKMKPLLNEYVKEANAKGLPGDEVLKFCLDYLKTNP